MVNRRRLKRLYRKSLIEFINGRPDLSENFMNHVKTLLKGNKFHITNNTLLLYNINYTFDF